MQTVQCFIKKKYLFIASSEKNLWFLKKKKKKKEITVWLIAKQSLPLACFVKSYEKTLEFVVI